MKQLTASKLLLAASLTMTATSHAAVVASFDDLLLPPAQNGASGLQFTNPSNSLSYQGVTWDSRFSVVGNQYRVDAPNGPLFGLPHSGNYYVTNQGGDSGLTITTDQILTGAWFGRNQYYGFSEGGADQITIYALAGAAELAFVTFDLVDNFVGLPEPLAFVDTSLFATLTGITGYRIDRREIGTQAGNWVADDFQFTSPSSVPEAGVLALLGLGLAALALAARRPRMQAGQLV